MAKRKKSDLHGKGASRSNTPRHGPAPKLHKSKKPAPSTKSRGSHGPQPTVPFERGAHVLLVGEGDFSFARSLIEHHPQRIARLVATTFETRDTLLAKHPQAEAHIARVLAANDPATPRASASPAPSSSPDRDPNRLPRASVFYSIDATRLGAYKPLRRFGQRYDGVVFNFPHTGGLSTDVNRQVRANQALLAAFLRAASTVLRQAARPGDRSVPEATNETANELDNEVEGEAVRQGPGSILVTLFEGVPYTLWNIKDLARDAGLSVVRSFRFPVECYPGYKHARTLGNLKSRGGGGRDEEDDTKYDDGGNGPEYSKGKVQTSSPGVGKQKAWKGEERPARTYEFIVKGADAQGPCRGAKRKRGNVSSDED